MTQTQKEAMYQDIVKHGNNLKAIFNIDIDPVKLCKRLRQLEAKIYKIVMDYSNDENGVNSENIETLCTPIMQKVYDLLNNGKYNDDRPHQKKVPIFFNTDPRGYALKINDSYARLLRDNNKPIYTDWGGYGILAPDFSPNN